MLGCVWFMTRLHVARDEFPKLPAGAVQSRAHRPDRAADDLSNLLITALLNVGKQHDSALLRGQLRKGFGNGFAQVTFDILLDWFDRQRRAAVVGDFLLITSLSAAKFVAMQIRDDSIDP